MAKRLPMMGKSQERIDPMKTNSRRDEYDRKKAKEKPLSKTETVHAKAQPKTHYGSQKG